MADIHVDPESLRTEGKLCDKQVPKTERISNDGHFLRFNADQGGLLNFMYVPSYHKVVTFIVTRCGKAGDRMTEIMDRLGQLAAGYEAAEARHIQAIRHAAGVLLGR